MSSSAPVALVTGAARRIGAAIARRMHADGYRVLIHYGQSRSDATALAATLNALRADSADAVHADLADFDRLPELIAQTVGRFGRLDALVNNASTFFPTPFGSTTPQHWQTLFDSNVRAPFFLAQAAAPHLRASAGGIVNISDVYATRALPQHAAYTMSKAALEQMTRALAVELAPQVRVNAVAPGAILWPENGKSDAECQAILQRVPQARTGSPEDIADAVGWLLGGAGYVTGEIIRIDGGRSVLA
ncbi:MAG: pteridine reductase [Pseudoxanthomonas suwonensis]|nr:MAG: pteridine reductase [Pseudoxanthomonas suwonensis]